MDESNMELDSFTADMVKRANEHKVNFAKLWNDESQLNIKDSTENNTNTDQHEEINEDETDESDFDDELLNDNYTTHVRKSISALLNVHKSILSPPKFIDEPIDDDKATRLNQRLGKLAQFYTDSEGTLNVLTENKMNIAKDSQSNSDQAEYKPKPLKDRLNNLARFYYPIESDEVITKPKPQEKQFTKQAQTNQLKVFAKSESSVSEKPKIIETLPRARQISVNENKVSHLPPNVSKQPEKQISVANAIEAKPEMITKKTSVANLKKLFEGNKEEKTESKEIHPELLSLKDKRRLFEKAILDENEASKNQYRKQAPPIKRLAKWEPLPREEEPAKRQKSSEIKKLNLYVDSPHEACIPSNHEADNLQLHNSESMSLCSDLNSEVLSEDIEETFDVDEEIQTNQISSNDYENEEQGDEANFNIEEQLPTQELIEKHFETIDNYSLSDNDSHIDTIADLTFSALESSEKLHRSSTKVDLKQDSQSSNSSQPQSLVLDEPPEKPARLYLYEDDEPGIDSPNPNVQDPPPLRTISFYRKEKQNNCASPMLAEPATVIHQADNSVDLRKFIETCNDKIESLKANISEHTRISGQASTALNLCLTHPAYVLSDSRIEAERLLLVSAEMRNACMIEIQKIKHMIKNPDKYSKKLSNVSSKGTIQISHFKVPLRNEFVDSRAKGKATSKFFFICLVYNGPNIIVSELLNSENNADKDYLEFKFNLQLKELNDDFAVRFQLFSLELAKEKSKNTISKSFRIKFGTSSLKRSKSPMNGATNSPIPLKVTSQPTSFYSVGQVTLNLATALKPPVFYRMESYSMITPIDGYLKMNISLKVDHNFTAGGYFDFQDTETSFWNLRWFEIEQSKLRYWRFREDTNNPPLGVIDLKHCINPSVALLAPDQRQICRRPNTFILVTLQPPVVSNAYKLVNGGTITRPVPEMLFISSQVKENSQTFCEQISNVLRNIRIWESNAVRPYSPDEFNRLLLTNYS